MGTAQEPTFDEDAWGEYDDEEEIDWDVVEEAQQEALKRAAEDSERRRDAAIATARAAQQKKAEEALRAAGATTATSAETPPTGRLRRPSPIASGGPRAARQGFLTKGGQGANEPCACGSGRKYKKCCGG